jgi:hypothetical protein
LVHRDELDIGRDGVVGTGLMAGLGRNDGGKTQGEDQNPRADPSGI